jgi:hypothetical protein
LFPLFLASRGGGGRWGAGLLASRRRLQRGCFEAVFWEIFWSSPSAALLRRPQIVVQLLNAMVVGRLLRALALEFCQRHLFFLQARMPPRRFFARSLAAFIVTSSPRPAMASTAARRCSLPAVEKDWITFPPFLVGSFV